MNELFNNGDYVLLEDCKAFDEKFGLEEDSTMWTVARKMEGGEPKGRYMTPRHDENCVGIDFDGDVGVWLDLDERGAATKLSVEDVLYRSKDGLTLDELLEIHGAYEEGKRYKCVVGNGYAGYFIEDHTYTTNGEGLMDGRGFKMTGGTISKFKPVTTKAEWVPSVGDEVIVHNDNDFELSYGKECLGKKVTIMSIFLDGEVTVAAINYNDINYCFVLSMLKPIDQERERIVMVAAEYFNGMSVTHGSAKPLEIAYKLYDAGILKEGDK